MLEWNCCNSDDASATGYRMKEVSVSLICDTANADSRSWKERAP